MDDIQSLCNRCIVINKGSKIYDGSTTMLFERFQTEKKITVSFDHLSPQRLPDGCIPIERNSHQLIFKVKKDIVKNVLNNLMQNYELVDISIEEDDIGNVVERIYNVSEGESSL